MSRAGALAQLAGSTHETELAMSKEHLELEIAKLRRWNTTMNLTLRRCSGPAASWAGTKIDENKAVIKHLVDLLGASVVPLKGRWSPAIEAE
jgi:hypothetical protein